MPPVGSASIAAWSPEPIPPYSTVTVGVVGFCGGTAGVTGLTGGGFGPGAVTACGGLPTNETI